MQVTSSLARKWMVGFGSFSTHLQPSAFLLPKSVSLLRSRLNLHLLGPCPGNRCLSLNSLMMRTLRFLAISLRFRVNANHRHLLCRQLCHRLLILTALALPLRRHLQFHVRLRCVRFRPLLRLRLQSRRVVRRGSHFPGVRSPLLRPKREVIRQLSFRNPNCRQSRLLTPHRRVHLGPRKQRVRLQMVPLSPNPNHL